MNAKWIRFGVAVALAFLPFRTFSLPIPQQAGTAVSFNSLAQQAKADMAAKNWQAALPPLQQLISLDPINWQLYSALGDVQSNLGQKK